MSSKRLDRLNRALAALKLAEMTSLGAKLMEVKAARARAAAFRQTSRTMPAASHAADMVSQDQWQGHLEQRARFAEAEARDYEEQAAAMRPALARTLGREQVVDSMIETARAAERRHAERRAEDRSVPYRR